MVTGIGFLGAGAIIRENASIRGLTTAACLWVAAALGIACGIGLFYLAICVTTVALGSLLLLKEVEKKLRRDSYLSVKVWGDNSESFIVQVQEALASCGIDLMDAGYDNDVERQRMLMEFQVKRNDNCRPELLVSRLSGLEGVKRVRVD